MSWQLRLLLLSGMWGLSFLRGAVVLGAWNGPGGTLAGDIASLGGAASYGLGFTYTRRLLSSRPKSATVLGYGSFVDIVDPDARQSIPMAGRSAPRSLLSFPNPVNEVSARLVAGGVVIMSLLAIALDLRWLTAVIAYGFVARVLTGPTLSPLGQLATRVVTPRLPLRPRPVAGPPKRFAQGIGAVVTVTAAVLTVLGLWTAARIVLGLIVVAASLEAFAGLCIGCRLFAILMRAGVVPWEVCERCDNLGATRGEPATGTG